MLGSQTSPSASAPLTGAIVRAAVSRGAVGCYGLRAMTEYDNKIELNPNGVLTGVVIFVILAFVTVGVIVFGTGT